MGAYLYYKVDKNISNDVEDWLEENETNKKLGSVEEAIWIYSERDLLKNSMHDYIKKNIGQGSIKTSGGISLIAEEKGLDYEDISTMWAKVFCEMNEAFNDGAKYYAGSCSLDENFFTLEQMKKFTKNGTLLGVNRDKERHLAVETMLLCRWNYSMGDKVCIHDDIRDTGDYSFLKSLSGKEFTIFSRNQSTKHLVEHYFLEDENEQIILSPHDGSPFPFIDADLKKEVLTCSL